MFLPDNLFYFLTLFSVSIFLGTYLLFVYSRNKLLIINIVAFFLCAVRATTEYYLPTLETIEQANKLAVFHSIIGYLITCIIWYCPYYYIRPFKKSKKEVYFNSVFLIGLIVIPALLCINALISREIFTFSEMKIDGYWQFTMNRANMYVLFYIFHAHVIMAVVTLAVFLHSILEFKQDRPKKILLVVFFLLAPISHAQYTGTIDGGYAIPNIAIIYLFHVILISWFVSGYRIFISQTDQATEDILNSISELAISTDLKLNIDRVNNKFREHFLLNNKEILMTFIQKYSSLHFDQIKKMIIQLIDKQIPDYELQMVNKDNQVLFFQIKVAKLFRAEKVRGYTFLFNDLTEIRQKEKKLLQLQDTKNQIFSIIGHDLRRPTLSFRGISKKIDYLVKKEEYENLKKLSEALQESAMSLSHLLDNLLNWAFSERKELVYQPSIFNIQDVTKETLSLYDKALFNKKITLHLAVKNNLNVLLDRNSFATILRNLIDNAIKFTPRGGKISIQIEQINDLDMLFIVKDTGQGISKEKLTILFDENPHKITEGTAGERGSGLGLSLTKKLVVLNKGTLKVSSEIGVGTSFDILFPKCIS